jgi:hypothetical protein
MIEQGVVEAIEATDTDELLRAVDRYCANARWDTLVALRERCQEAVGRGRQLWGVDEHIRYRLALEAPPEWSGPAVTEGPARFSLGPLAEVAASTKTWAELSPHLEIGPVRMTVAAERTVRGDGGSGEVADLPDRLQPWEPIYPLATYKPDKVETPAPPVPALIEANLPRSSVTIDDIDSESALADLVAPWTTESNGRCEVATVEGDAAAAIHSLGLRRARIGELEPEEAMAWMAWAGASGGAHGRRRGAAAGRYGAWWVVSTLADLSWPPDGEAVGNAVSRMNWHWFDDGAPTTGWAFRIVIEDPESGLSWAVAALDQAD